MPRASLPSLSWPLKLGIQIVITILLLGGAVLLAKVFVPKTEMEFLICAIIIIVVVAILSAAVGGIVTSLTSRVKLSQAEEELRLEMVKKAQEIMENTKKFLGQIRYCKTCADRLHSYVQLLTEVVGLILEAGGVESRSLVPLEELLDIEKNIGEEKEIWVLTSALELEQTTLKNIMFENMRKRVKYKYLLPNDETHLVTNLEILFREGMRKIGGANSKISEFLDIYLVPSHYAYMTVLVYDPQSQSPTVLVKFPQRKIGTVEKKYLSFRVPPTDANIFVKSLHYFMGSGGGNSCTYSSKVQVKN